MIRRPSWRERRATRRRSSRRVEEERIGRGGAPEDADGELRYKRAALSAAPFRDSVPGSNAPTQSPVRCEVQRMHASRNTVATAGLLAVAGLVAAIGVGPALVTGADHLDAPTVKTDKRIDITDIYIARRGASRTTLIMNVNPLTSPASARTAAFRPSALYEFKIDTNGDSLADVAYRIRFGGAVSLAGGAVGQSFEIRRTTGAAANSHEWAGRRIAIGSTTPANRANRVAALAGGGAAFAGIRDDPFFFDLVGFTQFKAKLQAGSTNLSELLGGFTGTDTFAGTNVSAIVLDVPNTAVGGVGRNIGLWATVSIRSNGQWVQVERMARPAINTVFNNTKAEKEAANRLRPTDDRAFDHDNVIATLDAIGNVLTANGLSRYTPAQQEGIANTLLPDVLTFKVGDGHGFLNGRQPANDVIDAELSLLTNGHITSDGVDANDATFLTTFPYLAGPHLP
jgi:uncharacterized protein DUF4331